MIKMYNWRNLTDDERLEILEYRKSSNLPWHSLFHYKGIGGNFHITGACYEHKNIIGKSQDRMKECEENLINLFRDTSCEIFAYCILPNHYHFLINTPNISSTLHQLKHFHGKSSYKWNNEDNEKGRKVWCNYLEKVIKSERHFYTSMNYIHNNPVHHNYTKKWQDWAFSSVHIYFKELGIKEIETIWLEYPVLEMGKGWDDPDI